MKTTSLARIDRVPTQNGGPAQSRAARQTKPAIDLPPVIGAEEPEAEETHQPRKGPPSGMKSEASLLLFTLYWNSRDMNFQDALGRLEGLAGLLEGNPHAAYERSAILLMMEGWRRLEDGLALSEGREHHSAKTLSFHPKTHPEFWSEPPLNDAALLEAAEACSELKSDPECWSRETRARLAARGEGKTEACA